MLQQIIQLVIFIGIAMIMGKGIGKLKLPAILGWLMTGMIIGPYALGWMSTDMMDSSWFHIVISIGEVAIGIMIGTELILKDIKESGKQILTICLTEALGTFVIVTLSFAVVFLILELPIYLAFVFGAIALATAPAPSLSIVNEYKTKGPITKTLIPLAALDDIIALIVFFTVIGIVSSMTSGVSMPWYTVPLMIIAPVVLGIMIGWVSSLILRKELSTNKTRLATLGCILVVASVGIIINTYVLPKPVLNLMLVGVSFSATFANLMTKERLHQLMADMRPILGVMFIIAILNLGAPLDYHLILGAGAFTAIYIIARAIGKYGGAYAGGKLCKAPDTVTKYLGLTLLPHSGVSLVFTGIAVSTLSTSAPEHAILIQGTIAAAAVINEIIAVFLAKQGFKMAGELTETKERIPELSKELVNV
ncbi:MAG: cation:proton antiporter [Turicibacter sp.]